MLAQEIVIQAYAKSGIGEVEAKRDVAKCARSKPAHALKGRPSDSAKTRPKRLRFALPALMGEMVKEVSVLAYEPWVGRLRVIGPEYCRITWIRRHELSDALQRVGLDFYI